MIATSLFLSFSINTLKNNALKSTREVDGGIPIYSYNINFIIIDNQFNCQALENFIYSS